MSNRTNAKRDKAKRTLANWYKLKLICLAFPGLLFIGLWVPPLARGDTVEWSSLQGALTATGIAVLLALMIAWVAWRCCFRSTWVANTVFCLTIIGCGVWSIALSEVQRAKTQLEVAAAIDGQVVKVKHQVLGAIE